tara:strand:+ start:78394 stop:78786 length:393 start_codon:yes stop_codon:yes gene_type:complete
MDDSINYISIDPDKLVHFFVTQKMRHLQGSEFKLLLLIYQLTYGRCLQEAQISLKEFVQYSGLAKNTVIRGLDSLTELDYIIKYTHTKVFTYALNTMFFHRSEGSEMAVQKCHIAFKHTPKQEFEDILFT